ncbi:MAG: sulfite exporter TauE/SafE family protein [Chitinophagaceae bacterium]
MEILGYLASVLIGISLGLVGSGGSILTVPVLVYLMGVHPLEATASSLFIVGLTSLVGGIRAYSKNLIDFRAITEFGIPSVFSIFIARHYILPAIPETVFYIGSKPVSKDILLMVVFAILMVAASVTMIRSKRDAVPEQNETSSHPASKVIPLIFLGLLIGTLTGLLGAGGGFLIIPSLVVFLGLAMKKAVGTSLLIIAINSLFGFLFSLKQFSYNWVLLLVFTGLAILGIFIGSRFAEKIPGKSLKRGFGWFILVMGIYIITKEILLR